MSYRDDKAALRDRVQALERELEQAQSTIARLQGLEPDVLPPRRPDWRTGAVKRLVMQRSLENELDDPTREKIAQLVRVRLPAASVQQIGSALVVTTLAAELRIGSSESGGTIARFLHDPKHATVSVFTIVLLAIAFISFPLAMYTAPLLSRPLWITSMLALLLFDIATARWLVSRAQSRERRNLTGTFEAMVDIVEQSRTALPRQRIATGEQHDVQDPIEHEEAEALAARLRRQQS